MTFLTSRPFSGSTAIPDVTPKVDRKSPHEMPASALDRIAAGIKNLDCRAMDTRSEEHTSELQSRLHIVCRLLLEKKKIQITSRDPGEVAGTHPPAGGAALLTTGPHWPGDDRGLPRFVQRHPLRLLAAAYTTANAD